MKKFLVVFAMLFGIVIPVNASAADEKSLVIIDSYFDQGITGHSVACISTVDCSTKGTPSKSISNNVNHGNAMVSVAKKQSQSIKIIGLRSASSPASDVNAGTFIEALKWVDNNSSGISAVSVSRRFNGNGVCVPAATNTANYGGVLVADKTIRSLIAALSKKGIPVFASTGNVRGKPVDYPACILETVAVSVGVTNKSGAVVSPYQFNQDTDYFVSPAIYSYKTVEMGLIPNTTSAATAALAAQYVSGALLTKFASVNS